MSSFRHHAGSVRSIRINPLDTSVQGDPDLETFQSLYFHFRESTLSDLAPSLAIYLYVYITICTTPPISPLYHTVLKTGGKVNIKTNDYSPLKKG